MAKTESKGAGSKAAPAKDAAARTACSTKAALASGERDWSDTLYLPKTEFPMRAGLPEREPLLLERWKELDLFARLRAAAKGRTPFLLHDGPPYANGNIHIGTGLNKVLKDVVVRSQQMLGHDANYIPGWDCHGLPIEWKVEEQYRAKNKNKDDVPIVEFRAGVPGVRQPLAGCAAGRSSSGWAWRATGPSATPPWTLPRRRASPAS